MTLKERIARILDVFSQRERASGRLYKPDDISGKVRAQIILFYRDFVNGQLRSHYQGDYTYPFWEQMHNKLQHLHGRLFLSSLNTTDPGPDVFAFLNKCNIDEFFDFIELSFKLDISWHLMDDENEVVDAVNEILGIDKVPFRLTSMVKVEEKASHAFGGSRQVTSVRIAAYPRIVRIEDEITHQEAVKPSLDILAAPHFEAASKEFREALSHYRKGEHEDCLAKCGSAFESVLKVLCKRKGWKHGEHDTTSNLLDVIFANATLEPFFKQTFMLIATMRNRLSSSHGGGSSIRRAERHIAQYALTSTAAAIVLLVHEIGV